MSNRNRKRSRRGKNHSSEVANFFSNFGSLNCLFDWQKEPSDTLASKDWWSHPKTKPFCLNIRRPCLELTALIDGYSRQNLTDAVWDAGLLTHFLTLEPDFSIDLIRFKQIFLNHPGFLEVFKKWASAQPSQKYIALFPQFERLIREHEIQEQRLEEAQEQVAEYEWIDLLSFLAIWWEDQYAQWNLISVTEETRFPAYIGKVASLLIRGKVTANRQIIDWEAPIPLMERFLETCDKCLDSQYWAPVAAAFQNLETYVNWKDNLDAFCYQGHQVVTLKDGEFRIIPASKEKEKVWLKIEEQRKYETTYYRVLGQESLPKEKRGIPGLWNPLNPGVQVRLQHMGIPSDFQFDKKAAYTPDLAHFALFLTAVGKFHESRYIDPFAKAWSENSNHEASTIPLTISAIKKSIDAQHLLVKPLMGPMNITTVEHLVDKVLSKTGLHQSMDRELVIAMIKDLAIDMSSLSSRFDFQFQEFPFLRFGDLIIYFSSNMVFCDPALLIQNWVVRKTKNDQERMQILANNLEKQISKLFQKAGFETMGNIELRDKEAKSVVTEIDVLAWKGNEILVIQAKNTFSRNQIREIEQYRRTLQEAGIQTDKSIAYIKANAPAFLSENGIDIDAESLVISGLVVSSTLEGNYERYGEGHYPKISLFELAVLLRNHKRLLVDWEQAPMIYIYDTWKIVERSISILMDRIESDWLWHDLIKLEPKDFPDENDPEEIHQAYQACYQGQIYLHHGKKHQAIPYFQKAAELDPSSPEYLGFWADALAEIGEGRAAIPIYTTQIDRFPEYVHGYYNRGLTYRDLGDLEPALNDFHKVLDLDPHFQEARIQIMYIQIWRAS